MKSRKVAGGYVVRLDRGEEVMASLAAFVKKNDIPSGFLQGIGSIRDFELGYFDPDINEYSRRRFEPAVEVVSLTGNISWLDNKPFVHAHVAVAGPDQNPVGGHFFSGIVAVTLEIFVRVFAERLTRTKDPDIGFNRWDP
jgi:predicted DNA-binding protein with PD1-like motif